MKTIATTLMFALVCARAEPASDAAPIDWKAHRATVVYFVLHDCPICNSYAPEMNRIARQYGSGGFGFVAAYVDRDLTRAEAEEHAREYQLAFPFVIDAEQKLAAKAGIQVAPEAAIFDEKGEIWYRGRIDDLYVDLGKRRGSAIERTLRDALDAIAAGGKPKRPKVPAIGCPLERAK